MPCCAICPPIFSRQRVGLFLFLTDRDGNCPYDVDGRFSGNALFEGAAAL